MEEHLYAVGQVVNYQPGVFENPAARGSYKVVRLLPADASNNQYRIKSVSDGHERVVKEVSLTGSTGAPSPELSFSTRPRGR